MKRFLFFALSAIAVLMLGGCIVVSVHPWLTPEDAIYDSKLLGAWTIDNDSWTFAEQPVEQGVSRYHLTIRTNDGVDQYFHARLFEIDGHRFLDLSPAPGKSDEEPYPFIEERPIWALHLRPVHSVWKVTIADDQFGIAPLDLSWFEKQVETEPSFIKHEKNEEGELLVTASSGELRAFLTKQAENDDAWGDMTEGPRVKPTTGGGKPGGPGKNEKP